LEVLLHLHEAKEFFLFAWEYDFIHLTFIGVPYRSLDRIWDVEKVVTFIELLPCTLAWGLVLLIFIVLPPKAYDGILVHLNLLVFL
jgi:hypothetical protein